MVLICQWTAPARERRRLRCIALSGLIFGSQGWAQNSELAMMSMTEEAAARIIKRATKQGVSPVMRIKVQGGGCSGMSYVIEMGSEPHEDDVVARLDGAILVCDPKSFEYVDGIELDYSDNILHGGFRFNNPKAKKSCSCGESFSV